MCIKVYGTITELIKDCGQMSTFTVIVRIEILFCMIILSIITTEEYVQTDSPNIWRCYRSMDRGRGIQSVSS